MNKRIGAMQLFDSLYSKWKTKPVGPLHTTEENWFHQFTNMAFN